MSAPRTLSPKILQAARKAASYKYDTSKYVIIDSSVKRDVKTGHFVSKENREKK